MNDGCKELVQSIRILSIVNCIEQSQLERECHSVRQLDILVFGREEFEPLEMKSQHIRENFDLHSFFSIMEIRE